MEYKYTMSGMELESESREGPWSCDVVGLEEY